MLFGFTSSFRMGQLLQYSLDIPARQREEDVFGYMCTSFIDAVRACLDDGGYKTTKDGVEEGGTFLVGFENRLFLVDNDFQIGESLWSFQAVGCGRDLALGAMHALEGRPDEVRVLAGLKAARSFSAGVCEPFHILSFCGGA